MAKRAMLWWVTLCALTGLVYCAMRRTAIRQKFGIAGGLAHARMVLTGGCVP